jgi:protein ImuB
VDRLACVDLPAFPLQLLLRSHPEWQGLPAAVVDEDKPTGVILWANRQARLAGVLPGLRYASALSLSPGLRAGTIGAEAIAGGVAELRVRLHGFSPAVEPHMHEPGLFWLDAGGFEHLFESPEAWAGQLRESLEALGFIAAVVVGFKRFGTYALAKVLQGRKAVVIESSEREQALLRSVPLNMLGCPPDARDSLAKLGVRRVADLLTLPGHGVLKRYGPQVHQLHRFAAGELELPLSPTPLPEVVEEHVQLDYREDNAERLVFVIKPLVDRLLARLRRRGEALTELHLCLEQEDVPPRQETIRTAEPTLASRAIMELVRLRLDGAPLAVPAVGVVVRATAAPATAAQLAMFDEAPRRDLAAAARAFARLRAAYDQPDVVSRAVPRERHSPEGCFAWEPLEKLGLPTPREPDAPRLVRNLFGRAQQLPFRPKHEPDGWLPLGQEGGAVIRQQGPYRLDGGWWRQEIERDYFFLETRRGDLLWVYYDRTSNRWYLQGEVC